MLDSVTVTITKTADGSREYVQIMSKDSFSVNVVVIADTIVVEDHREAADEAGGDDGSRS